MGLFSSSYETHVGTSVSRVCDNKHLPDSVVSGGLMAVVRDLDMVESVSSELENSVALKAEQMYAYGKNHYIHGLPSGQFSSASQSREEVAVVLGAIHGEPVTVLYSHYQPPNMLHTAWMKLVRDHGYDPVTNRLANLSNSIGKDVYLENMALVIPELLFEGYSRAALEQWGDPVTSGYSPTRRTDVPGGLFKQHTLILRDSGPIVPHVQVSYSWDAAYPVTQTDQFAMSVEDYASTTDYFQVKYIVGTAVMYWMYRGGSGTYPSLDTVFQKPALTSGTFYPFGYFRYNKVSETADKNSVSYKGNKKLLKYLGMDFDTVAKAIEGNPQIDDVEQAMVLMAVPANSTHPLELRYLFKFFDNLYYDTDNTVKYSSISSLDIAQSQDVGKDMKHNALVIQDKRFKMVLGNGGLVKRKIVGSIGKIGTHSFALSSYTTTETYNSGDWDNPHDFTFTTPVHIYRKQVSSRIYEEIQVRDLYMRYHIYGNYSALGDNNSTTLLIPLDRSITKKYSLPDREILYSRSLHYVFNSRVDTEVKWYQSDLFQAIMIFVAVIMFVFSAGTSFQALGAALAAGVGVASAVINVLIQLLVSLVVGQLLKALAKVIGIEAILVIALIAAIASGYMEFSGVGITGMPGADQLLQLASGLAKAASDNLADLFKALGNDFNTLAALSDASYKELGIANDLLENKNHIRPMVIFGETPNDFYNRTVHSGNVGINAIGAISQYVDTALILPKLVETLGDSTYGINT